jgi:hypothetical protein
MKKFSILVLGLSLLAAACNKSAVTPSPTPTPNPTSVQNQTYDNAYMKLSVQPGWTATQVNSNPGAVNIVKDKYILYINVQASQASGVTGGRFAEIAMGAPSADAVVTVQPSPPCGISETNGIAQSRSRVDLYVNNSQNKQSYCKTPTNGKTVWYFSYVSDKSGGYFNYLNQEQTKSYVVTMSYNSKDINSFPEKNSSTLKSMLDEMTAMVDSLEIKQK